MAHTMRIVKSVDSASFVSGSMRAGRTLACGGVTQTFRVVKEIALHAHMPQEEYEWGSAKHIAGDSTAGIWLGAPR
jgi:hypothetical protein